MKDLLSFLQDWLPILKDFILTGAAIVGGYVGWNGLNTWRRQLKGNTEYELAKKLLRSIYELREAIASVRHPFMQYSQEPEMPQEKLKELSGKEKQWHAMAQAYQKRWESVPKSKLSLDTALLEAEVVWGQRIVEITSPLNGLIGELLWAIEDHLEAMNPNSHYENPGAEEIKKRKRIMYARGASDQDEYKKRLEDIIKSIENELKPHIEQYHR
ncbi:hypothetical protein [Methylobacter sp. sgz302048]|uniref:hypothetical protein n=1 Tax=Methylobacter sp. sgz302048 TaxID=3455945 RepID=UPI003FA17D5B